MLRVETSQFRHTGTYAEVENLCQSWAQRYPDVVRCLNMGATAEGRIMRAIVVTRTGALTPEQAEQANVPVVLAIAGTHAGEIDGKDAGLMLIRDWLKKPPSNDPLQHHTSVPARTTAPTKTVQHCRASASLHSASTSTAIGCWCKRLR